MRILSPMLSLLALLGLTACTPGATDAEPARTARDAVQVDDAWARPADSSRGLNRTAVYFTLRNGTSAPTRLVHTDAEATGHAAIHRSTTTADGVMRMRPADTVAVASGETVAFAPGGYHVMLTNLTRPLRPGDRFPLQFVFASGDTLTARVAVRHP